MGKPGSCSVLISCMLDGLAGELAKRQIISVAPHHSPGKACLQCPPCIRSRSPCCPCRAAATAGDEGPSRWPAVLRVLHGLHMGMPNFKDTHVQVGGAVKSELWMWGAAAGWGVGAG